MSYSPSTPSSGGVGAAPTSPNARVATLPAQQLSTPAQLASRSRPLSPAAPPSASGSKVPSPSPRLQQPVSLASLRILLVRHGLSEDNKKQIWAGHRDSLLASEGVSQAKALGVALSSCSLVAIYSSDLKRASRTAEEILAVNRTVPPPTLVQTQSLREQNFGQLEGRPYAEAEPIVASAAQRDDARTFRIPEGETLDEVNARMAVSLRRYILPRLEALRSGQERGTEPQVAVVAHGIAIAEILRVLMNLHDGSEGCPWPHPRDTYKRVRLDNTGWTLVELAVPTSPRTAAAADAPVKSTYVRIVQQNVTDHLQDSGLAAGQQALKPSVATSLLSGTPIRSDGTENIVTAQQSLRQVTSYDARHLTRELERAGASASMLSGSAARDGSASQGGYPTAGLLASASANGLGGWNDSWQRACVHLLPLFNKEGERNFAIEEVNDSVREHIKRSLERSPARALDSLSRDIYALTATGMLTFNARIDNEASNDVLLLEEVVEVWKIFYRRVMPWLEASLLPLQTDPTLLSLSKSEDDPSSSLRTERIDVRRVVLTAFRDKVVLLRCDKLAVLFSNIKSIENAAISMPRQATPRRQQQNAGDEDEEGTSGERLYPWLLQLLNMCCSVLSPDDAQVLTERLVRALRNGHEASTSINGSPRRAQSAFQTSPHAARSKRMQARNAWMPRSAAKHGVHASFSFDNYGEDAEDDENADHSVRRARLRDDEAAAVHENAFLTSLRSPTINLHHQDDSVDDTPMQGDITSFAGPASTATLASKASLLSDPSSDLQPKRTPRSAHEDDDVAVSEPDVDVDLADSAAGRQRSKSDTVA